MAVFTRLYVVSFTPWLGETIPDIDFVKRLSGSQNELLAIRAAGTVNMRLVVQPAAP